MLTRTFVFLHRQVSAESANQFGTLVSDPVTNELLHYTEKPETFVRLQGISLSQTAARLTDNVFEDFIDLLFLFECRSVI